MVCVWEKDLAVEMEGRGGQRWRAGGDKTKGSSFCFPARPLIDELFGISQQGGWVGSSESKGPATAQKSSTACVC